MMTIGLIGGLSWYSTVEYYRVINEETQRRLGGHASAKIALQSLDFAEVRRYQQLGDWAGAGRLLAEAGRRCQLAGADMILICSNLMHKNAEAVATAVDVPLLHVADAVARRAVTDGLTKVGLLGSCWVMEEDFYLAHLRSAGLEVVVPEPADRELADRIIFDELTQGLIVDRSRVAYTTIINHLATQGAEAIILACTEIELLISPADSPSPSSTQCNSTPKQPSTPPSRPTPPHRRTPHTDSPASENWGWDWGWVP
ncbi:aspartate/glutamate racemase family protein [Kribbella jejuensis]|uniref:Aspartate racemase n=1 Tax=Kribbella jejuensis TaxID=236068 RepID=A0A542EWS3_9ACTN|nr:amino acid racemase [Kribbella jejuensis]TQJ19664.1 aspartate racemase [Kribbella jejuensis]